MSLTVIIPTYNRVNLIKYTLDSLDKKYHKGVELEVIVVDDGSTDNTKELINNNYTHVRFLASNGKGAPAARNTGLAAAKGEYILYLDSDDLIGPGFFEEKISLLDRQPDLNACYGNYDFFESNDAFAETSVIFKYKYPAIPASGSNKEHLVNFLSGNFIPPLAVIWRKNFLTGINGHDISLSVNQDVELFIRAIFNGLNIACVEDGTKVYIRNHALDNRVGDAGNSTKKWRQILDLRKKLVKDLRSSGYTDPLYYNALSSYLFGYWKSLRHSDPEMAKEYLKTAKEISWPVQIRGNILYRSLARILGPVNAVRIKYFIIKRD